MPPRNDRRLYFHAPAGVWASITRTCVVLDPKSVAQLPKFLAARRPWSCAARTYESDRPCAPVVPQLHCFYEYIPCLSLLPSQGRKVSAHRVIRDGPDYRGQLTPSDTHRPESQPRDDEAHCRLLRARCAPPLCPRPGRGVGPVWWHWLDGRHYLRRRHDLHRH